MINMISLILLLISSIQVNSEQLIISTDFNTILILDSNAALSTNQKIQTFHNQVSTNIQVIIENECDFQVNIDGIWLSSTNCSAIIGDINLISDGNYLVERHGLLNMTYENVTIKSNFSSGSINITNGVPLYNQNTLSDSISNQIIQYYDPFIGCLDNICTSVNTNLLIRADLLSSTGYFNLSTTLQQLNLTIVTTHQINQISIYQVTYNSIHFTIIDNSPCQWISTFRVCIKDKVITIQDDLDITMLSGAAYDGQTSIYHVSMYNINYGVYIWSEGPIIQNLLIYLEE
jgi:hypothetical protein